MRPALKLCALLSFSLLGCTGNRDRSFRADRSDAARATLPPQLCADSVGTTADGVSHCVLRDQGLLPYSSRPTPPSPP